MVSSAFHAMRCRLGGIVCRGASELGGRCALAKTYPRGQGLRQKHHRRERVQPHGLGVSYVLSKAGLFSNRTQDWVGDGQHPAGAPTCLGWRDVAFGWETSGDQRVLRVVAKAPRAYGNTDFVEIDLPPSGHCICG